MPWQEETIMSKKETFVRRALAKEEPFSQLCAEFNISRKTGYRLVKRFVDEGLSGLAPRSKRPKNSPNQTSPDVEQAIVKARRDNEKWGPRKLIRFLANAGMIHLPSPSTVTAILKRHNLITQEESLKRKKFIRFEREHPNDLWQMDFKGHFQLLTRETCYPLTIIDDHSRFSLAIKACKNEKHDTVKNRLISVFNTYGLPKQMNVDNGSPWGNSKLLPHTRLTVWLMRLNIRVTHSRPRHPQTNGKCERFHRTLKSELISSSSMRNFPHAQRLFNGWRWKYNHERPHEAIDMDCPVTRYQHSPREMPSTLEPVEYDEGVILRKVRGNGYISYNGTERQVGEAFKGFYVRVEPDEAEHLIRIYFKQHKIYTYDI